MPFTIDKANINGDSSLYVGTTNQAQEYLKNLVGSLKNSEGSIKPGVLKLIPLKDGSGYQLQRMRWWNPFHSRNKEDMDKTAIFIKSLLAAAYPSTMTPRNSVINSTRNRLSISVGHSTTESLQEEFTQEVKNLLLGNFLSYINKKSSRVGTQSLMLLLDKSGIDESKFKSEKILSVSQATINSDTWAIHQGVNKLEHMNSIAIRQSLLTSLKAYGVQISQEDKDYKSSEYQLLKTKDQLKKYVFQFQGPLNDSQKTEEPSFKADLLAKTIKSLESTTKPIFVVLKVHSKVGLDYYSLPVKKATELQQELQLLAKQDTNLLISIAGQLVAKDQKVVFVRRSTLSRPSLNTD